MGRRFAALILLAAVTVLVYARTTGYPFVYDDEHVITDNPAIREISEVPRLFTAPGMEGAYDTSGSYRPALFSTYALDYHLGGLNPAPYHWTSILIHIINCFLVFMLIEGLVARSGRDPWPWSLALAGLYCLHPVQTEAVIYTSARSALMCTTFLFAAALFYFNHRARGKAVWLPLAYASYLLALLTKESAAPFFLVFFLLEDWLREGAPGKKFSWARVIPFAAASALFVLFRFYMQKSSTTLLAQWGMAEHILTEISVLPRYLKLLVLPYGLTVDHDVPLVKGIADPYLLGGVLILAASAYFAVRCYKTNKLVTLLIAWPFLSMAMEMIVPLPDLMVEYRLYPALAGIAALAALSLSRLEGGRQRRAGLLLAVCLLAVFGAVSFAREKAWSSEAALWEDAVAKAPNLARPYNNLGDTLNSAGEYERAEGYLLRALELKPGFAYAYISLGKTYQGLKQYDKAAAMYEKAIELGPDDFKAYQNYGMLLGMRGEFSRAEEMLKKAIELAPSSDAGYVNLGNVYSLTGKLEDSVLMYKKAVALNGRNLDARINLGISLAGLKRYRESFDSFMEAAAMFPEMKGEMANCVTVLMDAGQKELALRLEQAIASPAR